MRPKQLHFVKRKVMVPTQCESGFIKVGGAGGVGRVDVRTCLYCVTTIARATPHGVGARREVA